MVSFHSLNNLYRCEPLVVAGSLRASDVGSSRLRCAQSRAILGLFRVLLRCDSLDADGCRHERLASLRGALFRRGY